MTRRRVEGRDELVEEDIAEPSEGWRHRFFLCVFVSHPVKPR